MSNSKSDQTVTGNPPRSDQSNLLPVKPATKVTQRGQRFIYKARTIFILKPNFKNRLTTEKIPK